MNINGQEFFLSQNHDSILEMNHPFNGSTAPLRYH